MLYWRMTLGIDGLVGLGHGEVGRVHGGACGSLDVNDLRSLVAVADTGFVTTHDEQDHVEENLYDANAKDGTVVREGSIVAVVVAIRNASRDGEDDNGDEIAEPQNQIDAHDGSGMDAAMASAHAEADALSKVPDEGEAGGRNKCDEREKAPVHGEGSGDAYYDEAEDD